MYDTKQLQELKEEISANLLEKVNDFMAKGGNEDAAFKNAVASLGDMSELVASIRRAAKKRAKEDTYKTFPLDRKHALAYVTGAAVFLFGLMTGGAVYLWHRELFIALSSFIPFLFLSALVFCYFCLTQETRQHYGMNPKRALSYTIAVGVALLGAVVGGILYLQGRGLLVVFATSAPLLIIAGTAFLYLRLTEKSRRKMNQECVNQWIEYYSNPHTMMLRGSISGALWIFSVAAFFLIALIWGWKYSWIVFIIATGIEVLLNAFFTAKGKED